MKRSSKLASPVVTFLSPSIDASRRAQSLLSAACSFRDVPLNDYSNDKLDIAWQSASFLRKSGLFNKRWDSVASTCTVTGSVIHFCSIDDPSGNNKNKQGSFSLLGITDRPQLTEAGARDSVKHFRDLLSQHTKSRSNMIKLRVSTGMSLSPTVLLRSISSGWGLPILSLPTYDDDHESYTVEYPEQNEKLGLKEIVVPYFDQSTYVDGSTIQSKISEAQLTRKVVGVYRWKNSAVSLRPLPTASEDKVLPPSSLIIHCNPETERIEKESGIRTARIGYGGNGVGQLMLMHDDLAGLDIRYCPNRTTSSSFCEAQESLMAGSLGELQSTNALGAEPGKHDNKVGNADCWIEVRANLKKPSGYLRRGSKNTSKTKIAKIPDLPFE